MSKIDPRYKKGQIYCVRCRYDDNLIYVGSTINILSKRFYNHKTSKECSLYKYVNGDWDNWYIELYEEYPCNNKPELERREGQVQRQIATINNRIAGRTHKEYRDENRDKIKEANRVQDAKRSDYLKEKVECEKCKSIVSRHHLLTHTRSNKCLGKL